MADSSVIHSLIPAAGGVGSGIILCLSFVVAPLVFKTLDGPAASRFLRALFPRYYRFLAVLALAAVLLVVFSGHHGLWPALVWLAAAVLSLVLVPAINAARDAGASGATRFKALHGLSVGLNFVMLGGSALLAAV
jgi:hypothetical protein